MTGGSKDLTDYAGNAGHDTKQWKLMKGDQEITEGVTISIIPIFPSGDRFPNWIGIDKTKDSPTYHHVIWSTMCAVGKYMFQLSAKYGNDTFQSDEITLNINPQPVMALTGGLLQLTGSSCQAGYDAKQWKLMKQDTEITEGVTMSIVPTYSSAGQFPDWIFIDESKESPTYHCVTWSDACLAGEYKFKVRAKYENDTFESPEIALTIIAVKTIISSGFPEGEQRNIHEGAYDFFGLGMSLKFNNGYTSIELLNDEHFSELAFTFYSVDDDIVDWIKVVKLQEETYLTYAIKICPPIIGQPKLYSINAKVTYDGIEHYLPSFSFYSIT